VELFGISFSPLCVVMEHMAKGSLHDFLHLPGNKLDWKTRLVLIEDIAQGRDRYALYIYI
jgi:hypothetical protein